MADNYRMSDSLDGAGHAADDYPAFAVDGEFYAIGFPDGEEEAKDGPDSSSVAASSPLPPPPHDQYSDNYLQHPQLGLLTPSPPGAGGGGSRSRSGSGSGGGGGGATGGAEGVLYFHPPNTFDHTGTAFHNLSTSSPLFSPGSNFATAVGALPSSSSFSAASSSDDVFPDTLRTPDSALAHLRPASPPQLQQAFAPPTPTTPPHERPRLPSLGGGAPPHSPPLQTARTLVDTVVPAPDSARRKSLPTPTPAAAAAAGNRCSTTLRKVGTVKRTMSMRGGKPRVTKVRVVNKTDSKSYFSVERTMYQWIYMSAVILGNALTFYGVVHPDLKVMQVAHVSATLLSFLALVVAYYAAIYAFRRRLALNRQAEAAAFDDRFGPIAIVGVTVVVFIAAESLALRSAFKAINGKPFSLKQIV